MAVKCTLKRKNESAVIDNIQHRKKAIIAKDVPDKSKAEDARNAVTHQNQLQSPLLRIPRELRDQIYENVFAEHNWNIRFRWELKERNKKTPKHSLGLLFTCRQIHAEASVAPFQSGVFVFFDRWSIAAFLKKTQLYKREKIKAITFAIHEIPCNFPGPYNRIPYTEWIKYLKAIADLPSLKTIYIDIRFTSVKSELQEAYRWGITLGKSLQDKFPALEVNVALGIPIIGQYPFFCYEDTGALGEIEICWV